MIQTIVATFITRITTPNPVVQGSKGTHMGMVAENRAEEKKKRSISNTREDAKENSVFLLHSASFF